MSIVLRKTLLLAHISDYPLLGLVWVFSTWTYQKTSGQAVREELGDASKVFLSTSPPPLLLGRPGNWSGALLIYLPWVQVKFWGDLHFQPFPQEQILWEDDSTMSRNANRAGHCTWKAWVDRVTGLNGNFFFFFKLGIINKNLVLQLHRWLSCASLETNMFKKKSCPFHSHCTGIKSIQDPHRWIKGHLWMFIWKEKENVSNHC